MLGNVEVIYTNDGGSKEEWLEARRQGVGGSDIGAIAGLNKWSSPLKVYLDKKGELPPSPTNFKALVGNELEPLIRKWTEQKLQEEYSNDIIITDDPNTYQSVDRRFAIANLDGVIENFPNREGPGLLEIKTASAYLNEEWEDDKIPESYIAQCQWYMGIMGYDWTLVSYSIDNREPQFTFLDFDPELFEHLLEVARNFWGQVENDIIPGPIGHKSDQESIEVLYPEIDKDDSREINDMELEELIEIREEAKELEKRHKKEKDRLTQEIELRLGATGKVECGPYKINYYEVERTGVDSKKLKIEHPDIFEQYAKVSKFRTVRVGKRK